MRLNKASDHQKEEIFALILDNARWLKSLGVNQWPEEWIQNQKDSIFSSVSGGYFYAYFVGETLAAVVELRTEPQELWAFDPSKAFYIYKLAVARPFKGEGVGRLIINEIINWAKAQSLSFVRLDCAAGNAKLQEYYKSLGFDFVRFENYRGFESVLLELPIHNN